MYDSGKAYGGGGGVGRIGSVGRYAENDASTKRPTFHQTHPNNDQRIRDADSTNAYRGSGGVGRIGERKASGDKIGGFKDLDVYKNSYEAMLIIFKKILPILPSGERYDLYDQIRRSSKAVPRLIAEGHSKRHQNRGFQKYIDDAHAESNETIVSISQVRDLYAPPNLIELCDKLIDAYDKISRQLYNLALSWEEFHKRNKYRYRKTPNDSPDATEKRFTHPRR